MVTFFCLRQSIISQATKQILSEGDNEEDLQLLIHLANRMNIRRSACLPAGNLSEDPYTQLRQGILNYPVGQKSSRRRISLATSDL